MKTCAVWEVAGNQKICQNLRPIVLAKSDSKCHDIPYQLDRTQLKEHMKVAGEDLVVMSTKTLMFI